MSRAGKMEGEKNGTVEKERCEGGNEASTTTTTTTTTANVTNEVANMKLDDGVTTAVNSGNSTPGSPATGSPAAGGSFLANFKAFSKFGDPKSDGKSITLSQSDKWMKQAKVIDGKRITTTDTGIYFKKHKLV